MRSILHSALFTLMTTAALTAGAQNNPAPSNTTPMPGASPTAPSAETALPNYSDRERLQRFRTDKEQLERTLGTGHDKAYYRRALENAGYWITAVNYDRPDYLEYEVVKNSESYEVQVSFDQASGMSNKVDVDANMWHADTTSTAMSDRSYRYVYPSATTTNPERYSDRERGRGMAGDRTQLQGALGTDKDRNHYRQALEQMGWQVTAVNADRPDYIEYEVVKGDRSYEVQASFDAATGRSTKIEVEPNIWRADSTVKAMREPNR